MTTPVADPNPFLDAYAAPQTLVRIGRRRRLHLRVSGAGDGPTVVLAAGLAGGSLDWILVQHRVARFAQVVSYDPPGLGFSDPGPLPRSTDTMIGDLRAALAAAGFAPPYILCGHSAGGLHLRHFAHRHPDEVAGLVLVDSVLDDWERRVLGGPAKPLADERRLWRCLERAARAGTLTPDTEAYRAHVRVPQPGMTPAMNAALHAMRTSPAYYRAIISESLTITAGSRNAAPPPPASLGDLPLAVLSAARIGASPFMAGDPARVAAWLAMHETMAGLSTRGVRRVVDCGHNIPIENPGAVVEAIRDVMGTS